MTQFPELWAALGAPFGEVRTRTQAGRQLSYLTARMVMNRLDEALGPENWWDDYRPAGDHSTLCVLTVRLPDGSILSKCDAGGNAGMSDQGDDDKSAVSDAFKRAAVKFGVGRYLYRDGVPTFRIVTKETLALPAPAPAAEPAEPEIADPAELQTWLKGLGLTKKLAVWSGEKGYPQRMGAWSARQVRDAHAFCREQLRLAAQEAAS